MTSETVKWLPHGMPIPSGWTKCADAPAHHGRHAVLITPLKRKTGTTHLLEWMPLGWFSAQKLADQTHRNRNATRILLLRAVKKGWVERRRVDCPCCASSVYEYRRIK